MVVDSMAQGVGETTRDPFKLGGRILARIELDAALGATERDVREGRLPGHPGRQRPHLADVHERVVA